MQHSSATGSGRLVMLPLENFETLQRRYQSMRLGNRAIAVLEDAKPALQMADALLASLSKNPKIWVALDAVRKNTPLIEKMRNSEAKQSLQDRNIDFIITAQHKLASWRKTIERIAAGEGIVALPSEDYIPAHVPLALAISNLNVIGGYLSIIQLVLAELMRIDEKNAETYNVNIAKIRRCATYLSDCELASSIATLVH